jgi:hypothetical protein
VNLQARTAQAAVDLTLSSDDYLELLPVEWRQIDDYGTQPGSIRTLNSSIEDPVCVVAPVHAKVRRAATAALQSDDE